MFHKTKINNQKWFFMSYLQCFSRENVLTKHIQHLNDSSAFIDCSNAMGDAYENFDDYNPSRKRKILIDKLQAIIKELLIRCRKLNIFLVFITESFFMFQKLLD